MTIILSSPGSILVTFGASFEDQLDPVTMSKVTYGLQQALDERKRQLVVAGEEYTIRGWVMMVYNDPDTVEDRECEYDSV